MDQALGNVWEAVCIVGTAHVQSLNFWDFNWFLFYADRNWNKSCVVVISLVVIIWQIAVTLSLRVCAIIEVKPV